ncbi:DUF2155 domain-containing protein [Bradyrhizobium sp. 2TAF24]|uniref:DUF2155 domain-containing protein n=1 Tax=Bradyrhizobium sp. 2TAF24 TaxID=3233011 RepID=UPI003F901D4D
MFRTPVLAALATLIVAPVLSLAPPAQAQIGNIFSNPPPRPPAGVPGGNMNAPDTDEEDVPDLPTQGRILPIPSRPQPGIAAPPPGSVQSQPLPPPPGTTVVPQTQPGVANAPQPPAAAPGAPGGNVANAPAAPNAPAGPRPPRGGGTAATPPAPASLQPGDEIVTEPPAQKIVNKKAVFSGLDKITGRIINFDVDIGETVQFGALRVKPDACYTRPATEATNTDAFVEVEEITLQGEVKKIFSGWMFAASPGLHGVEHPIYDIWLTDCKAPDQTVATQVETPAPPPKPAPPPAQRRQQTSRQPLPPPGTGQLVAPPRDPPPQQQPSGFFPPFRQ